MTSCIQLRADFGWLGVCKGCACTAMCCNVAGKRLSAKAYLEQWGPKLFPGYFGTFLHPFFAALLPMDADERVAAVLAAYPQLLLAMQPSQGGSSGASPGQHHVLCLALIVHVDQQAQSRPC